MLPQSIGPYGINKELGRGTMGVVYLGYDSQIGRPVAIKTIQAPSDDPHAAALREGLGRDARAAGRLLHPNIVTIFHMGTDGDTLYVAMEYVAGSTVAGWSRAKPRSFIEILDLLRKVADALDYAHQLGIVHRDIKPANVLVTAEGQPKVNRFRPGQTRGRELIVEQPDRRDTALYEPGADPRAWRGRAQRSVLAGDHGV